jgi:hypothetical protein
LREIFKEQLKDLQDHMEQEKVRKEEEMIAMNHGEDLDRKKSGGWGALGGKNGP